MARPKPVHYVSNKELFKSMVVYIASIKEAEAQGLERPPVPHDVGLAIWKIAENLGKKGNFSGYSYLDEMKSDGIENCLQYIHNFNPEKSQNPFAYFTRIIWFAFLRRIEKEKKEMYVKYKLSIDSLHTSYLVEGGSKMSGSDLGMQIGQDHTATMHKKMAEFAEKFETDKNIKPKKKKGIEKFIGDDDAGQHTTNHSESNLTDE